MRAQKLTGIAQTKKAPTRVANRLLPTVLYGPNPPYGGPGGGDPKAIALIGRGDLTAFEQRWLRPDNVKIFVVSDRPLSEIQPQLESSFGQWAAPAAPRGTKSFTVPPPRPASPRTLPVD